MPTVMVIGAGTMGAGIAQTAAASGWSVLLRDVDEDVVRNAIDNITRRFDRLVEKGKLSAEQRDHCVTRLAAADSSNSDSACALVIEAVAENLDLKTRVLRDAAQANPSAILASNTSSLSITELGQGIGEPKRTVGMHFFNPVPLMPLVEVISGKESATESVEKTTQIAREWGKTPAVARDTPGFIVNRVARGYYLESLRMLGEGIAGVDEIDHVMKSLGGFRMGPFELMDLVGIDVNYTVSCSVFEQLGRPARLRPHPIQKDLFEKKLLGRKTKQGFYTYQPEHPYPAVPVRRKSFECSEDVYAGVRLFCQAAIDGDGSITEQYIVSRNLIAIINEAALALDDAVATAEDIDIAMKLGTNYPNGPIAWAEKIGRRTCRHLLDVLNRQVDDQRFTAAAWLRE